MGSVSTSIILLVLLATLAVGVWAVGVFINDSARRGALRASVHSHDDGSGRAFYRLEQVLVSRTPLSVMAKRMAAADVSWSPLLTLLVMLIAMLVIMLFGQVLLGRIGSTVLALLVPMFFSTWVKRRAARRGEDFIAQLPELARILANGNSAGLSMGRCLAMAGREMTEPAGLEMRRVANRLNLGWSVDRALTDLSERLPSREIDVLVRTIVVQSRTGGTLTKALMDISQALDDRKELRREVATVILGSAVSGYAVIFIGGGAIVLLNLMQPGLLDTMAGSLVGRIVLLVALALFASGLFLMRLVSRVEV